MSRLLRAGARHVAKSAYGPTTQPFRWLRIYDNSAGKPATPANPALGVLLLEIDLTASTWIGPASFAQLSSVISGSVLALGMPLYMRCVSNDGLTVTDTDWTPAASATAPSQEVIEGDPPDDSFVLYPGVWLPGTPVSFGAGDLVYTP